MFFINLYSLVVIYFSYLLFNIFLAIISSHNFEKFFQIDFPTCKPFAFFYKISLANSHFLFLAKRIRNFFSLLAFLLDKFFFNTYYLSISLSQNSFFFSFGLNVIKNLFDFW